MAPELRHEDVFETSHARFRHDRPSSPIRIESDSTGGLQIPDDERSLLLDYASWKTSPPCAQKGRSAFVVRKEPLKVNNTCIEAYKLKGTVNCDDEKGVVTPPSNIAFSQAMHAATERPTLDLREKILELIPRVIIHMGINDDGTFRPILDPPKPLGGLAHGRGRQEFRNAVRLHDAGVAACGPVAWGKYPDLEWEGEAMEFVILSLMSKHPERISDYFEPDLSTGRFDFGSAMKELIHECFEMYDSRNLGRPATKITARMAHAIGKVLRQAHEQGRTCRFAGHTGNFSYLTDKRQAFMHDFDSSVGIDELHPNTVGLSFVRDIGSALVGFFHSVVHSRLFYLARDEEQFRKENPAGQILYAYFKDDGIDGKVQTAMNEIYNDAQTYILLHGENPPPSQQAEWLGRMHVALSDKWMRLAFGLYQESQLMQQFGLPYTDVNILGANLQKCAQQTELVFKKRMMEIMSDLPQWAKVLMGV